MKHLITAKFLDANQPSVSEEADSIEAAVFAKDRLARQYAALKSIHIDVGNDRHVFQVVSESTAYLFTVPLPLKS